MSIPLRRQLKAAQNQLNMEQATYVDWLKQITGKTSSTQLNKTEINAVLIQFKKLGWQPKQKHDKQIKVIQFLWIRLGEEGKLTDKGRTAMYAFCNNYVKSKSIYKATSDELSHVIDALKGWCRREGVSMGRMQ